VNIERGASAAVKKSSDQVFVVTSPLKIKFGNARPSRGTHWKMFWVIGVSEGSKSLYREVIAST
jgi:hypothetical protein